MASFVREVYSQQKWHIFNWCCQNLFFPFSTRVTCSLWPLWDILVLFPSHGFHGGFTLTNLSWKQPQNLLPLSTNYPLLTSATINTNNLCLFRYFLYTYAYKATMIFFKEFTESTLSQVSEKCIQDVAFKVASAEGDNAPITNLENRNPRISNTPTVPNCKSF